MSIEEKLIRLVRANELLYNRGCIDYRNNELKDRKWREIATILRVDVLKAKQRWKSLRDRFTREQARLKVLKESGRKAIISWKFYNELEFLKNHTKESQSRIKFEEDTEFVPQNENTEMFDTPLDEQQCMSYDVESVDLNDADFKQRTKLTVESASLPPLTHASGRASERRVGKEMLAQKIEESINKLMGHISSNRGGNRQNFETPVHAFFNAMAVQIEHANLPLSTWFALQQEIMQLINNTITALNPE